MKRQRKHKTQRIAWICKFMIMEKYLKIKKWIIKRVKKVCVQKTLIKKRDRQVCSYIYMTLYCTLGIAFTDEQTNASLSLGFYVNLLMSPFYIDVISIASSIDTHIRYTWGSKYYFLSLILITNKNFNQREFLIIKLFFFFFYYIYFLIQKKILAL